MDCPISVIDFHFFGALSRLTRFPTPTTTAHTTGSFVRGFGPVALSGVAFASSFFLCGLEGGERERRIAVRMRRSVPGPLWMLAPCGSKQCSLCSSGETTQRAVVCVRESSALPRAHHSSRGFADACVGSMGACAESFPFSFSVLFFYLGSGECERSASRSLAFD